MFNDIQPSRQKFEVKTFTATECISCNKFTSYLRRKYIENGYLHLGNFKTFSNVKVVASIIGFVESKVLKKMQCSKKIKCNRKKNRNSIKYRGGIIYFIYFYNLYFPVFEIVQRCLLTVRSYFLGVQVLYLFYVK